MIPPSRRPSMRRNSGVALLAALLALGACEEKSEEARKPARPVLVVEAKAKASQIFGPFAGTVQARYESKLGFRTPGRMIRRDAYVGDLVHKGDTLARLDETLLRFALLQAKSDVQNAAAQLSTASAAQSRKRALVQNDTVPQSDVDAADADQKTAQARLDQAGAVLAKAQDNLGYAELHADYDGVVMAWDTEVGQEVAQGAGVVTVAPPDVREAVIDIPDDLIGNVREKDVFTVTLQAGEAVTAKSVVREVAPGSESATRTRRVRFTLDNPSDAFRLGSTVTVTLATPIPPRFEIPGAALLHRDGRTAVWVVAPGAETVALRDITVAGQAGGVASVTQGIGNGDRIVAAGIHRLKDGQAVRVMTSFPPSPSADR